MQYLDEYRDAGAVRAMARAIARTATRPWTIMEVCGGQTHSIVKYGLDQLLPDGVELIHGPGCPVCVTPLQKIDTAITLAQTSGVILCSFGDMLRVPGSTTDLLHAKAEGADVRVVYSPLEAVKLAKDNPGRQVVFFGVGFETTAPANAMAAFQAKQASLTNFSMIVSHVLVPPAIFTILASGSNRVQGFLAAGHVCTIMGYQDYEIIATERDVPIVVTGFEPLDVLQGVYMCLSQLEKGQARVENQYARAVRQGGNDVARAMIQDVFAVADMTWRGLGVIPKSGLAFREPYQFLDAETRFGVNATSCESGRCQAGSVLTGAIRPPQCPEFGRACTPESPLGAPMVSSEGACAAYFHYKRNRHDD